MTQRITPPSVAMRYGQTGASTRPNELGMRPMQEAAYAKRGEQYLLIKSPPASGKSRALMYIALDKLTNQSLKQAIIVVPERSIGGSFADAKLTQSGFWADWTVAPQWNLCNAPGIDAPSVAKSKVKAVAEFLKSTDRALVCTHATFRFAVDDLGIEAFDERLIAIDEFHHVSAADDNVLGAHVAALIARDKVHLVAMTGSFFRGDAVPVLTPEIEARFETVTYTYYQQLEGYTHLKALDIGYSFYSGPYTDSIGLLLDSDKKTIVHIPHVGSRESTGDKHEEVARIMQTLGEWQQKDPATGFDLIRRPDGRLLKVADLVDADTRERAVESLKDPEHKNDRDHVDIIIALGMAKEGFDWIWCEHALTIGYRNSLTEIVQIIGRATRDAPGKERTRFTNMIAEPDASEDAVVAAVNDTLKAIAASLLMEQVLVPRFVFSPKDAGPKDGVDYGAEGYRPGGTNIGVGESGAIHVEIKGLIEPESPDAQRVCREDINELIQAFVADSRTVERGLFDEDLAPQELTQLRMGKIVQDKYKDAGFSESDQEAIRQHAVAALNLIQSAKAIPEDVDDREAVLKANTAILDGVRKFALSVTELDIDLIDRISPFQKAYEILSRSLDGPVLRRIQEEIAKKRINLTFEESVELARRAVRFQRETGRNPDILSADPWEKRLAEGAKAYMRYREQMKKND